MKIEIGLRSHPIGDANDDGKLSGIDWKDFFLRLGAGTLPNQIEVPPSVLRK